MKRLELTPAQVDELRRDYVVQSETVRGEARVHYAMRRDEAWSGPSRPKRQAAELDAEYHVAGRFAERLRQ